LVAYRLVAPGRYAAIGVIAVNDHTNLVDIDEFGMGRFSGTCAGATPTPAMRLTRRPTTRTSPVYAANSSNAGSTLARAGRLRSVRHVEMRRVVRPAANCAVVTVLNQAVGVVPIMITAVGRPFARNTSIDQDRRQASPKPRAPPVPTTALSAHQYKLLDDTEETDL
jgi:hypothetical protein